MCMEVKFNLWYLVTGPRLIGNWFCTPVISKNPIEIRVSLKKDTV